ncbi:uncharacterized protein LOC113775204 isoform X2 [Coffea eugenioides]|uniref:uncharacterized protein LOC113775204 isoform X2 n=1 Tax=Coffea eugenioides TaxID=49369 RepID=UPI000F60FA26|nr:uncharacterized protein LOC113775204 isoform X2 [Coffea eugenioides]
MPGTVQVSVLEFKGLPSTCLKLSLGKREYQTSDTGDFLFPLTTLHDNLVVRLLDAEGNEIALTGIQTMSIVEKVSWDENFPLDGGGHVHLKLQFVLNQEERNRIRLKREAAVKKKQESFSYISNENPEIATSVGGSVTLPPQAEQQVSVLASLLPNTDVSPAGLQSNYQREEVNLLQVNPKAMDKRAGTFTAPKIHGTEAHQIASEEEPDTQPSVPKVDVNLVFGKEQSSDSINTELDFFKKSSSASIRLEDDDVGKSPQRGPLEKTPSNVRKLVSAFESSLPKDVKSSVKAPTVRSEPKKVGKGGHLKDCGPKDVTEPTETSSGRNNNPFVAGDMKPTLATSDEREEPFGSGKCSVSNIWSKVIETSERELVANIRPVEKEMSTIEWTESCAQLERSSTTEKASTSGRMHTDHSERAFSFRLSAEKQHSSATSYAEGKGRTDSTKTDFLVASIKKSKSVKYCEEENFNSENSGMWIFPNDTKHLCITTAGKRVMNLLGTGATEAKLHQKKNSSSSSGDTRKHGSDYEMKKREKESQSPRISRSESSSNDASGGLVGQVIKIAIIVGFGILVFFTRQREPRKSKRDTNDPFFTRSEYMDEHTTTAEQVD